MKKLYLFIGVLLLSTFTTAYGEELGKIGNINSGSKEIVVNINSGIDLKIGDLLQVQTNSGKITLEVTYPMLTVVKCKIKGNGRYSDLSKGMVVSSFNKDENKNKSTADTPGKVYKIGDKGPAGGWIFYDKGEYSNGWRYLEAAPKDQSSKAEWGCQGKMISSTTISEFGIGIGKTNTEAIITSCGESEIAAKFATDYRGGGKSDWFLPSRDELNLMHTNLKKKGIGGFANGLYWCSSIVTSDDAWYQIFGNQNNGLDGYQYYSKKDQKYRVRAIRAF